MNCSFYLSFYFFLFFCLPHGMRMYTDMMCIQWEINMESNDKAKIPKNISKWKLSGY